MQANKDEADKCVDFAKRCINNGDREKARRLLLKARKMFPSSEVDSLLEFLTNFQTSDHDEANIRRRKTKERPTSPERKEPAQANYTAEQLEQVRKLKSSKNHYEVLGVSKDAGDSELKKSYRKLALQFHPDKNLAPGATEAFKAIGTAFSVLSNAEKRKQYDMYLANPSRDLSRGGGGREYTNDFEGDITAEELFRMFFCGNHQGATFVRRNNGWRQARTQAHHPEGQVPASSVFFQLLPILVLVFLSLMSSWFVSDPVFSLKPSNKYSILRRTSRLSVTYYVKESFGHDYHGNMYALEQAIEEAYVQLLRNSCAQERIYKDNMLWRARNFGDSAQYKKAQGLTTPSCLRLQEIYT